MGLIYTMSWTPVKSSDLFSSRVSPDFFRTHPILEEKLKQEAFLHTDYKITFIYFIFYSLYFFLLFSKTKHIPLE